MCKSWSSTQIMQEFTLFFGKFTQLAKILHDRRSWWSRQISTLSSITIDWDVPLFTKGLSQEEFIPTWPIHLVTQCGWRVLPPGEQHRCQLRHLQLSMGNQTNLSILTYEFEDTYNTTVVSSVRSSNSHPNLLVTQQHPLFQITPVLNTGLSLSEPLQLYKGYKAM